MGDWSASNTMLNGRFSSSNPISFKWPTTFGTQSCDILSGVPVPGTRPRLKRQKSYDIPRLRRAQRHIRFVCGDSAEALLRPGEAQKFIDAYWPPVELQLSECASQDLVIFTAVPNRSKVVEALEDTLLGASPSFEEYLRAVGSRP